MWLLHWIIAPARPHSLRATPWRSSCVTAPLAGRCTSGLCPEQTGWQQAHIHVSCKMVSRRTSDTYKRPTAVPLKHDVVSEQPYVQVACLVPFLCLSLPLIPCFSLPVSSLPPPVRLRICTQLQLFPLFSFPRSLALPLLSSFAFLVRKCRIRGCQRKTLIVGPADNDNDHTAATSTAIASTIASEATHCAAQWQAGSRPQPQETVSPQNTGSLLQDGQQVAHSADPRGSGTGGGNTLLGGLQAAAVGNTAAGGRAGKGKGNGGGSVSARPRRASGSLACRIPGCSKRATHGPPAEATRCAAHKEKGQIDHKHRLCENTTPEPCLKQPSFGWPGESRKRKRFCSAHRPAGTVDLRNCEQAGCGTRASHGFGKGRARFCALHSPPGTSLVANRVRQRLGRERER